MRPLKVVVADDQAIVRGGVRAMLDAADDIQVVGEAEDGGQAVELVLRAHPDVVVMDIRMPNVDGIEATRRLMAAGSRARILMLTTFNLDEYVFQAMRAGAAGFLLKATPPDRLAEAVRVVAAGDSLLDPMITRRLVEHFLAQPSTDPALQGPLEALTDREKEILRLLARGLSNAQMGERLFLSETTVKSYVTRLLGKLDVRTRVQAVVLAYETGLVRPGEQSEVASRLIPALRPGARSPTGAYTLTGSRLPSSSMSGAPPSLAVAVERGVRRLGDQQVGVGLAGQLLDPRGGVDGVADHREVDAPAAADGAGDDLAGVDADADLQPRRPVGEFTSSTMHARRLDRALGVVGLALGRAEHGDQPVADELVDVAAVLVDARHGGLEQLVQLGDDLVRLGLLGERGEVADVEEQDGHLDLLALQVACPPRARARSGSGRRTRRTPRAASRARRPPRPSR